MFDPKVWAAVPFHFWTSTFFVGGAVVGSFLNVCIHRLPRGLSLISPPSHCPHCGYSIPWHLNMPLVTWLFLRGQCANCRAPISARYFVVELLTGMLFAGGWLAYGHQGALLALAYCLLFAGFIVATFIDFEHFIIPDEVTLGGLGAGFVFSALVPALHQVPARALALERSFLGIAVGAGLVYAILRLGKLAFGRQRFDLAPNTKVLFTETGLLLPDKAIPFEDLFYRKSDAIMLQAKTVELIDRCYANVLVRLTPVKLTIGADHFDPEHVPHMEVVTEQIVVPREAMGLGDVKFMAAIGAFLGWQAVIFALMLSSIIGAAVGVTLIVLRRREWSSRLPYGPYIALASVLWVFAPTGLRANWVANLTGVFQILFGSDAAAGPAMTR
ncbi:MAG: prepilin peptidase [Verrucomicrobia bacterium]|nr:prepilin peptidase [Verrucomicrobiota bacterium]